MPIAWLAVKPAITISQATNQSIYLSQDIRVESHGMEVDRESQRYHFLNGVKLTLGPTTIECGDLLVDAAPDKRTARASGDVILIDPDGSARARSIDFSWEESLDADNKTVTRLKEVVAVRASIQFAGATFQTEQITIRPDVWELQDAYMTNCRGRPPSVAIRSPLVTLYPGRRGKLVRPEIEIFGRRIVTLPNIPFNLDKRTQGIRFPTLIYRQEDGFGIGWETGILLGNRSALSSSFVAFPSVRPSYSVQYGRSFLKSDRSEAPIVPRSDLNERFGFGYFENVFVSGPQAEFEHLEKVRSSLSVGTSSFLGSANTVSGDRYSKPIEFAYERGGLHRGLAYLGQLRAQSIRQELDPTTERLVASASIGPKPIDVSPKLQLQPRVDVGAYSSEGGYGFLHLQLGATYRPIPAVTLGAAWVGGPTIGSPQYDIDEPLSTAGLRVRFDLNAGPTQFSYLWRYDHALGWFDRQYYLSQVVGCFRPYVIYRQYSAEFRFGVTLRLDNLIDALSRKDFQRSGERKVLSGPGRASE